VLVSLLVNYSLGEGSCGEKLAVDSIPVWNETLFWPYTLGNTTVVGYNNVTGYVEYLGHDEAEVCPADHKKECCVCSPDGCDDRKSPKYCPPDQRPCDGTYFCTFVNPVQNAEIVPQKVKPDPNVMPPMSRNNILQRAVGWIAHSFPYAGNGVGDCNFETCGEEDTTNGCPNKRYISVCNGLVAMAWRVPNETPDNSSSYCVDCHDLLPGDGIHLQSHWIMFMQWTDGYKQARVWQMGGSHGKANEAYYEINDLHYCRRRRNIINETVHETPCRPYSGVNSLINPYVVSDPSLLANV